MTAIFKRQRARLYTQKAKKKAKRFYIQKAWHFSKSYTISVTCLYPKSYTLDVPGFSWNFWSWHFNTKSMTLCVMWRFNIQKARHFAKSKTICDKFLYSKIRHFCVTQLFIEFLKFAEGADIYAFWKNVLCLTFLYQKNNAHFVTFLYPNRLKECVTF